MSEATDVRTSDGVRMAILSSRMESVARKMQNTLFRTARSGVLNTAHDFSDVNFTGNIANCETCHLPGTYSTEAARARLATTISTGTDAADPSDDLNISQTAAVCGSCHDSEVSETHMILHGASFHALDADID